MKNIFGIPISDDEEICEETLHEFGCGCSEAVLNPNKEVKPNGSR